MAKSRRNRAAKAHRSDPIAPKVVKPPSDPELAALRESKILPVLKDLKSPDPKSRTAAAGAIANIVEDTKSRKLLLREQVVHTVLTETLTDTSIDSRAAGWRILRVLAQEEDTDFCVHIYRLDVLTALQHASQAVIDTLTASQPPFEKLQKAQQQLVWDIASSLVFLLTALATARDEIVESIAANQTITRFLFRLSSASAVSPDLHDETLQCLMVLAEDNLPFGQALINDTESRPYDALLKFSETGGSRAAISCGVLHNLFTSLQWQDHSPGKDGASDLILIPKLSRILEQTAVGHGKANGHEGAGPTEILQTALETLASIGTDLQAALEQGNKAQEEWKGISDDLNTDKGDAMDVDGSGDEDEDEDDGGEEDRELEDDNLDEDMEKVTGGGDEDDEEGALEDLPTLRELLRSAIPQIIRISQMAPTSDQTMALQGHALSALNNISWTVSLIDFANGENANIFRAWAPVAKKIWVKTIAPILESDSADMDLATVTTSLAWAISRSLGGVTPLKGDEHRKFIALYQASRGLASELKASEAASDGEDPFQSLGVKCVGVLGQLARDPAPLPLNRDIGVFLFTVLESPESPPADVVEAVNQVLDIYGDENLACDEVFWKDNFLRHLQEALPNLRARAKGVDKKTGELRQRFDEAVVNLTRFITYKKKHMPKDMGSGGSQ
ncbi:hypothetical protein GQ53DRAFT_755741 [Thozetella sp. PMI_491]|nr:hypothetical protein GQ53DRAFT_755741 [Thozetella sp. PMI_491]